MGRSHREQGIQKKVSEDVYPADILSDFELMSSPLDVFGAWMKCLLWMWRDGSDRVDTDWESLARAWGCREEQARQIVMQLADRKVCDVTADHGKVILVSRRRHRMLKEREKARLRQAKSREKKAANADVTPPVTPEKVPPSSSPSLSPSSSPSSSGTKVPSPEGQADGPLRVELPKGLTIAQKKRSRVAANTPSMNRVGAWFGRKESTCWSVYEAEALQELFPLDAIGVSLLERYYTADIEAEEDYRRRDLATLLNNWQGEIDRAQRWAGSQPSSRPAAPAKQPTDLEYVDQLEELYRIKDVGTTDPELIQGQIDALLRKIKDTMGPKTQKEIREVVAHRLTQEGPKRPD